MSVWLCDVIHILNDIYDKSFWWYDAYILYYPLSLFGRFIPEFVRKILCLEVRV